MSGSLPSGRRPTVPTSEHVADIDEALQALGDLDVTPPVLVKGSRVAALNDWPIAS